VAIEIAKRARVTLAIENMEASHVPNKILIPLIEKASNEAFDDSFMLDKWANLLARRVPRTKLNHALLEFWEN
jgi:hypothetical protein